MTRSCNAVCDRRFGKQGKSYALIVVCLFGLIFSLLPQTAWANAFTVEGIAVDVTADSPTSARQKAIRQGQKAAFSRLLQNVTKPQDRSLVPKVNAEDVESLVADFSVRNEKTTATRYIATMTVNFDENRVARFLQQFGVELTKSGERTLILLGIYVPEPGAEPLLWEHDNPWRLALNQTAVSKGLFPVAVPLGDVVDQTQVSVEKARALDQKSMDSLLQRYGADEIIVAEVVTNPDNSSELALKRYPRPLDGTYTSSKTVATDDLAVALDGLAENAVLTIANDEKKLRKGVVTGDTDSLPIIVPVRSISDWVLVDTNLRALPNVKSVMLRASRTDIVQAAVQFSGTEDELRQNVERIGFSVTVQDGYWEIQPYPQSRQEGTSSAETSAQP